MESNRPRRRVKDALVLTLLALTSASPALAQPRPQQPSPMVETTRAHTRLAESAPPGRRMKLGGGSLFVPEKVAGKEKALLFVHFHGPAWLAEIAADRHGVAVISFQLGS